jgi:hypothetical protein
VATCAALDAEALQSPRNPGEYSWVPADRHEAYECVHTDDGHWRVRSTRSVLVRTGRHGAVGIADLLTAVLPAEHGMTALHSDSDVEIAAEVLDFEHRWGLPRGTA